MLPITLLPETIAQADGFGPAAELKSFAGRLLVFTLGITRAAEQESLEVSVWGSSNQEDWGVKPITALPPKSYCGVYSVLVNLVSHPEVRYLRVHWRMKRWAPGERIPLFGFYSFVEESGARVRRDVA